MITPKRAVEIVRKKYPKGDLFNCFLYRNQFYIFRLQETEKPTLGSTFLSVNRKTGVLTSTTPTVDLTGFFKDMREHPLDVEGVLKSDVQQMGK